MSKLTGTVLSSVLAVGAWPSMAVAEAVREAWADVIRAEPVRQEVRIPEESEVCWDEQVLRLVPARRSVAPKLLGAVIGGVIGHQFGGGSGQDLMTAAGAVLGASVAADQQYSKYPDRYYPSTEQRCQTRTNWRLEDRIVAWDVTYEFNGEVYQSRLSVAPGDRIRVRVGVQPLVD
jgi:uncharacterized protein YcfJ